MSDQIRIELTDAQKDQVRKATGKDAEAVELSVEELEERIAPSNVFNTRAAGKHRASVRWIVVEWIWMDGMNDEMDGWMEWDRMNDEWMDGWMDGWMNGWN